MSVECYVVPIIITICVYFIRLVKCSKKERKCLSAQKTVKVSFCTATTIALTSIKQKCYLHAS